MDSIDDIRFLRRLVQHDACIALSTKNYQDMPKFVGNDHVASVLGAFYRALLPKDCLPMTDLNDLQLDFDILFPTSANFFTRVGNFQGEEDVAVAIARAFEQFNWNHQEAIKCLGNLVVSNKSLAFILAFSMANSGDNPSLQCANQFCELHSLPQDEVDQCREIAARWKQLNRDIDTIGPEVHFLVECLGEKDVYLQHFAYETLVTSHADLLVGMCKKLAPVDDAVVDDDQCKALANVLTHKRLLTNLFGWRGNGLLQQENCFMLPVDDQVIQDDYHALTRPQNGQNLGTDANCFKQSYQKQCYRARRRLGKSSVCIIFDLDLTLVDVRETQTQGNFVEDKRNYQVHIRHGAKELLRLLLAFGFEVAFYSAATEAYVQNVVGFLTENGSWIRPLFIASRSKCLDVMSLLKNPHQFEIQEFFFVEDSPRCLIACVEQGIPIARFSMQNASSDFELIKLFAFINRLGKSKGGAKVTNKQIVELRASVLKFAKTQELLGMHYWSCLTKTLDSFSVQAMFTELNKLRVVEFSKISKVMGEKKVSDLTCDELGVVVGTLNKTFWDFKTKNRGSREYLFNAVMDWYNSKV